MHATHLVIGRGSAGCVMAARLSEAPDNKMILLEAGRDYPPDRTPDDIRDTYLWECPDELELFLEEPEGAPPRGCRSSLL